MITMGETKGVNHLALITHDMNETVRFYTQVLGMRLVRSGKNDDDPTSRHYFFDMGDGSLIGFFDFPGSNSPERMHHIALAVDSLGELEAFREKLVRKGVGVSEVVDHDFIKSVYFRDPNGILLEVSAYIRELTEGDLVADPDPVPAVKDVPKR